MSAPTMSTANQLNKRMPANPRLAHVRTKLDTGHNMRKVFEKLEGTGGAHAHKKKKD